MAREEFEVLKQGVVKRKARRIFGLFVDGAGLDRATRRIQRKVDLGSLVRSLCTGIQPEIARYYTLVPHQDDARQFAFLDAVERAGMEVVVKRLPPKGVKRQVSMDVHMACDILRFCEGRFSPDEEGEEAPVTSSSRDIKRSAVIVCPNLELSYAVHTAGEIGAETTLADFGNYGHGGWKSVDKWIDLSASETIWKTDSRH